MIDIYVRVSAVAGREGEAFQSPAEQEARCRAQNLGYRTAWAANANEALELLGKNEVQFDLVFSDIIMPGMNGIQLAEAIRRTHPGLPIVLTSGYSNTLAEEGSHGFDLVHKPYSVEALSRVLKNAMSQSTSA